ncbi:MAG: hypothetical protein DI551_11290, partial [Micavibrio aeruginosavorus]
MPVIQQSVRCGSIVLTLFASIAMVGLIGVAATRVMQGPVKTMTQVTKRTIAENNMMSAGRLVLIMSAQNGGDCDHDGMIEPLEWVDPNSQPAPAHGGLLPTTIGASLEDPWGNSYGYCAW